jgi:hypothetical protein
VTDGPYLETKEYLASFYLLDCEVKRDEGKSNAAPPVSEDWWCDPGHNPHRDSLWPDRCCDQRCSAQRVEIPRQSRGRQELLELHAIRSPGQLQSHPG